MVELVYGLDPLSDWCYGLVPAMRQVRRDHPHLPIRILIGGLISDDRVRPYAELEGQFRAAADRFAEITGRHLPDAFFRLIATPGVMADSGPPTAAIATVLRDAPAQAVEFHHAVSEAHFTDGRDLNDPETYRDILAALNIDLPVPDLTDTDLINRTWAEARGRRLNSFPTLAVIRGSRAVILPQDFTPSGLSSLIWEATR